jgi:fructose-1,6-bisphosphatase/inositol monophosphatase family enzyme
VADKSNRLTALLASRMREVALSVKSCAGRAVVSKKESAHEPGTVSINTIVTDLDFFVQGYLCVAVNAHHPDFLVYGEECSLFAKNEIGDKTVIIDPIDGTEWLAKEKSNYSILSAIMIERRVVWAGGIFPETGEFIFCESKNRYNDNFSVGVSSNYKSKTIGAHYRIDGERFIHVKENLRRGGFSVCTNMDGLGTNLSFARLAKFHNMDGFVAVLMSIVDGFPLAKILSSFGMRLRFYEINEQYDVWKRTPEWTYFDLGSRLKFRTRFIAAWTEGTLDEIELATGVGQR